MPNCCTSLRSHVFYIAVGADGFPPDCSEPGKLLSRSQLLRPLSCVRGVLALSLSAEYSEDVYSHNEHLDRRTKVLLSQLFAEVNQRGTGPEQAFPLELKP